MTRLIVAALGILLALASKAAFALVCTSTGALWNNAANWSCGRIPTVADSVIINTNLTVNVATANVLSVTVNPGFTLTQSSSLQTAGALVVNGTLNSTNTIAVTGATTVAGSLNITAITGTHTFTGGVSISGTWNVTVAEPITIGSDLTNTGTFTSGTGAYTFPGASIWAGSSGLTFGGNVTVNAAVAITNNTTVSVTGTLALGNGATMTNNSSVTVSGNLTGGNAASTWTNVGSSTLEARGTLLTTGTLVASDSGNLVHYNVNAAQAVKLPSGGNYFNLTVSGGNTKTPSAGTYNIGGDLTINAGVTFNSNTNDPTINVTGGMTVSGTYTGSNTAALAVTGTLGVTGTYTGNGGVLNLSGDFTQSGTFTSGAGIVTFTGGAAQTFGGTAATTITNLTVNKAAATDTVSIAGGTPSPTASGTLTLTTGMIVTAGASCATATPIIVAAAGTIAGGSSSSYVQGALRKNFAAAATLNFRAVAGQDEFPVGTASGYSPIEITAGTTSTAGNIAVCATATDDPNMTEANGGGIDTAKSVNRYWSMSTATINTAAVRMDATFKFVAGDVDGLASTANFTIERYDGTKWNPTTLVTAGGTSTRANLIDISSATNEFQIGEPLATFPPVLGAFNAFDTTAPAGAVLGAVQTKQVGVSFSVRAIRLLNNAIDAGYNQAGVTVELYDASNNSGAFTNGCRSTWAAIAGTSQTVTFAAGVVTVALAVAQVPNVYRDVRVHIVKVGAGAGEGCSTDRFAIRPTSLTIDATDATWQTAGTTRLLTNTGATGGNVHAASDPAASTPRPFTLRASPQAAGGQSASNYDGTPTTVAGFPTCIAPPASCAAGTLSYTGASWSGTGLRTNATAHYTEAGVFNLQLEDATYAAVDANDGSSAATRTVPATGTVSIGRFVPDHFDVTTSSAPAFRTFNTSDVACSTPPSGPKRSFTYIGQGFGYVTIPSVLITAKNAAGTTTANYKGNLWKIGGATSSVAKDCTTNPDICQFTTSWSPAAGQVVESYTYTLAPVSTPNWDNGVAAGATASVSSNGDGTGTVTFSSAGLLAFKRNTGTPQVLFTASVTDTLTAQDDTESGTSGNATITTASPAAFSGITFDSGNEFRYGQLRILNASGPTSVDVPMTLRAEYYTAAGFTTNAADNCTPLAPANFKLSGHQGSLTSTNMSDSHVSVSGTLTAGLASNLKLLKPSPAVTTPGAVKICLDLDSAPGVGDTTCQAATPANQSYLQGPWSGSSAYDKDPPAQMNLGVFGAQPKNFIYFRENY